MKNKFVYLFVLFPFLVKGQTINQNQIEILFPLNSRDRPQLDSSINVGKLPLKNCYQLIEKMFVIDQKYRDSLYHTTDKNKRQRFTHLMTINDPVHQTILLKILKVYGWPCQEKSREVSYKAWVIAWHARSNLNSLISFNPYLIDANSRKCINNNLFIEYQERIKYMKKNTL